jgi:hypothetical protein
MKINASFLLLLFLSAAMVFGPLACGRKSTPTPETNTTRITRAWKVRQVDATANGTTTPLYQEGVAANAENFSAFRLNFTSATNFRRTEKDASLTEGTWSFNSNETQVNFNRGNPTRIDIQSLSNNSLVFTYAETNAKNQSRELRFQMVPL